MHVGKQIQYFSVLFKKEIHSLEIQRQFQLSFNHQASLIKYFELRRFNVVFNASLGRILKYNYLG